MASWTPQPRQSNGWPASPSIQSRPNVTPTAISSNARFVGPLTPALVDPLSADSYLQLRHAPPPAQTQATIGGLTPLAKRSREHVAALANIAAQSAASHTRPFHAAASSPSVVIASFVPPPSNKDQQQRQLAHLKSRLATAAAATAPAAVSSGKTSTAFPFSQADTREALETDAALATPNSGDFSMNGLVTPAKQLNGFHPTVSTRNGWSTASHSPSPQPSPSPATPAAVQRHQYPRIPIPSKLLASSPAPFQSFIHTPGAARTPSSRAPLNSPGLTTSHFGSNGQLTPRSQARQTMRAKVQAILSQPEGGQDEPSAFDAPPPPEGLAPLALSMNLTSSSERRARIRKIREREGLQSFHAREEEEEKELDLQRAIEPVKPIQLEELLKTEEEKDGSGFPSSGFPLRSPKAPSSMTHHISSSTDAALFGSPPRFGGDGRYTPSNAQRWKQFQHQPQSNGQIGQTMLSPHPYTSFAVQYQYQQRESFARPITSQTNGTAQQQEQSPPASVLPLFPGTVPSSDTANNAATIPTAKFAALAESMQGSYEPVVSHRGGPVAGSGQFLRSPTQASKAPSANVSRVQSRAQSRAASRQPSRSNSPRQSPRGERSGMMQPEGQQQQHLNDYHERSQQPQSTSVFPPASPRQVVSSSSVSPEQGAVSVVASPMPHPLGTPHSAAAANGDTITVMTLPPPVTVSSDALLQQLLLNQSLSGPLRSTELAEAKFRAERKERALQADAALQAALEKPQMVQSIMYEPQQHSQEGGANGMVVDANGFHSASSSSSSTLPSPAGPNVRTGSGVSSGTMHSHTYTHASPHASPFGSARSGGSVASFSIPGVGGFHTSGQGNLSTQGEAEAVSRALLGLMVSDTHAAMSAQARARQTAKDARAREKDRVERMISLRSSIDASFSEELQLEARVRQIQEDHATMEERLLKERRQRQEERAREAAVRRGLKERREELATHRSSASADVHAATLVTPGVSTGGTASPRDLHYTIRSLPIEESITLQPDDQAAIQAMREELETLAAEAEKRVREEAELLDDLRRKEHLSGSRERQEEELAAIRGTKSPRAMNITPKLSPFAGGGVNTNGTTSGPNSSSAALNPTVLPNGASTSTYQVVPLFTSRMDGVGSAGEEDDDEDPDQFAEGDDDDDDVDDAESEEEKKPAAASVASKPKSPGAIQLTPAPVNDSPPTKPAAAAGNSHEPDSTVAPSSFVAATTSSTATEASSQSTTAGSSENQDGTKATNAPPALDLNAEASDAVALYVFTATVAGQISIQKRDRVKILEKPHFGWWTVLNLRTQESGHVPSNFLREGPSSMNLSPTPKNATAT